MEAAAATVLGAVCEARSIGRRPAYCQLNTGFAVAAARAAEYHRALSGGSDALLIVMQVGATEAQVREVEERIRALGYRPHPIPGAERMAIGITAHHAPLDPPEY